MPASAPRPIEHRQQHGEERQRHQFGMLRQRPRYRGRAGDHDREQAADEGDLAALAVRLPAVEQHQHPEDREHQSVAQQGAEQAPDRAAGRRAAPHEIVAQRHELLVRFARHDLVRPDDAVAGADDVLARIHALAQLVAPPFGLRRIRHERGPEEMTGQLQVHGVADARSLVRMHGARARQVQRVRHHLFAWHRRLTGPPPDDQLLGLLHLQHARARGAERQRALDQLVEGLLEVAPLAALRQIRGLAQRERHPLLPRRLDDRLRAPVRRGVHGREEGVYRQARAVESPGLKLVDRLDGGRQLFRLAGQLLVRLADRERERRDQVAVRELAGLEQRCRFAGARGEREVGEEGEAEHPRPALAVIAHLILRREVHLSPERPRRRRG